MTLTGKFKSLWEAFLGAGESRESVADGFAIGIFVAFLPLIGLQTLATLLLAFLLRRSRAAAVFGVWIANPFSISPLYLVNYWLGTLFYPDALGLPEVQVALQNLTFETVFSLSQNLLIPLAIGSLLAASVAAFIARVLALRYYEPLRRRFRRSRRGDGRKE